VTGRIRYGGDYNPEQWPSEVWDEDVRLMVQAGVNLVTVGVFSWAQLEPAERTYSFAWLHEVLDLLGDAGIGVDLATPTASPPPWLSARYPDVLPVDARGARYSHGSRQHFCVCSASYRARARRVVERLVSEVANHPAIEMWHVHNEYGCHVPYCYCDNHAQAFRAWLQRRYGSVDELNEAWGTTFWSQRYGEFAEVLPPRLTPTFVNPGQELDYKRFSNDAFLEEFFEERQILRTARPDIPVTTNFMGFFKPLDYFAWASELDVVSTDNYADPADPDAMMLSAMHYDLVRSLNKDAAWMVMEQTPLRVNWRRHNSPKVPGQMRAMSYQAVARGAAGVLFFQWRASRSGAEKFHSAMVSHSGVASPVWAEVAGLGRELDGLGTLEGSGVDARVAMVFSWANWWALEAPAKPANDLSMTDQLSWMYRPLFGRGATVDFCRPDERLDRYEVVLVPSLYLVTEEDGAKLVSYVERRRARRRLPGAVRGPAPPPDRLRRGGRGPIARGHDDRGRMGGRDQDGGFFLGRRGDRGHGPCAGPRRQWPVGGTPGCSGGTGGPGTGLLPGLPARCRRAGACVRPGPGLVGRARRPPGRTGCGARGAHLGRPHVRVPHKPLGGGKGARYRLRGV
jgi:beta-galactosidase